MAITFYRIGKTKIHHNNFFYYQQEYYIDDINPITLILKDQVLIILLRTAFCMYRHFNGIGQRWMDSDKIEYTHWIRYESLSIY